MSNLNISNLPRITPNTLASQIRSDDKNNIAIIDVRDTDYVGGHIIGCQNVPTNTHDYRMPELLRTLRDKDVVVFHCALSQQRGPGAALRYLREKERLGSKGKGKEEGEKEGKKEQKVVVLEGGFVKWQELYGEDKTLTEGYQKDIWEFGY